VPLLGPFQGKYPHIKLRVTFTDRYIDLIEEGVDVCMRLGEALRVLTLNCFPIVGRSLICRFNSAMCRSARRKVFSRRLGIQRHGGSPRLAAYHVPPVAKPLPIPSKHTFPLVDGHANEQKQPFCCDCSQPLVAHRCRNAARGNVWSWRKLTCDRQGAIRLLTQANVRQMPCRPEPVGFVIVRSDRDP
jgi:DNA-binding transcriptional LysR family regulator